MSIYYINKANPNLGGYEIVADLGGFRWRWREVAKGVEYVDDGPLFDTAPSALRDAATDWEDNGMSSNTRFAGTLRAAATRAEKAAL